MAVGNAIVNTARFKPLTVAEWSAPLREYALRHDAMDNALMGLSSEAEEYDRYIRENPNDPISLKYKDYINKLDEQATLLAEQGITPQSRRDLLELYKDYNRNIKPIKSGVAAYQNYQKNKLAKDDGTLIGNKYNVWDFINNPDLEYSFTKGSDIQKEAMAAAIAKSKGRVKTSSPKSAANGDYYSVTEEIGYSPDDIKAWIYQDTLNKSKLSEDQISAINDLNEIAESVSSKFKNASQEEVMQYVLRGITDGAASTYNYKQSYLPNRRDDSSYSSGSGSGSSTVSTWVGHDKVTYRQRKDASGNIHVDRKTSSGWEPAPYFELEDGTRYDASDPASGKYGTGGSGLNSNVDETTVVMTYGSDKKPKTAGLLYEDFNDRESFADIDLNDKEQRTAYNDALTDYLSRGYSRDQLEFKWDKRKSKKKTSDHVGDKKIIVIVKGVNQKRGVKPIQTTLSSPQQENNFDPQAMILGTGN